MNNALHKIEDISIFSNDNHLGWMVGLFLYISEMGTLEDHPSKLWFELVLWILEQFSADFWSK